MYESIPIDHRINIWLHVHDQVSGETIFFVHMQVLYQGISLACTGFPPWKCIDVNDLTSFQLRINHYNSNASFVHIKNPEW